MSHICLSQPKNLCAAAVNVASTLVAIIGVDRVGRRFLFIASGILMVMCEIIVGVCLGHFFHVDHGVLPDNVSNGILAVICIYVANFAWSWGMCFSLSPSPRHMIKLAACTFILFNLAHTLCLNWLALLILSKSLTAYQSTCFGNGTLL